MAYTQKPGRGNGKKTGGGLSPMLMGGSAMYQKKDPYSGKTFRELGNEIENYADKNKQRIASEMIAKSDSTSTADNARKLDKTLSKKMAARLGNEAANKTRTEKKIPRVNRGKYTDGSYMAPSKLGDTYTRAGQLERDFPTGLITAYRKSTPTKQVSKGAFKKPATTSTTAKPKASKTPMKQASKMPTDRIARDKRPTTTMERNRAGVEPTPRKVPTSKKEPIRVGGRSVEENGIAPPKPKPNNRSLEQRQADAKTAPMTKFGSRRPPAMQMSKLKKKC